MVKYFLTIVIMIQTIINNIIKYFKNFKFIIIQNMVITLNADLDYQSNP